MGFRWQKTTSQHLLLFQKKDIHDKKCLTSAQQFRNRNHGIIFKDESYVLSLHVQQKSWSDKSLNGFLTPVSKGHFIMILAGGENSYIPNALVSSHQAAGDYKHESD